MNAVRQTRPTRSWVAAGVLFATLLAGGVVPGSGFDKWLFSMVSRAFHPTPQWVGGFGTRQTPWSLRHFDAQAGEAPSHVPSMVQVGDDPNRVFQSSPLSPLDFAVIFSNLKRLGTTHAACSVVLAWDSPDMIGLTALEKSLDGFESMLMAAPLTRGSVAEPMPSAFRRASLPVSSVKGDRHSLPLVNRVAVPDMVLGKNSSWAGFSMIECEADDGFPFVCARWEDRIVLSFALCHALRSLDIPLESIEIRLGECVRLGTRGPIVPIDKRGRLCVKPPELAPRTQVAAEDLIDAQPGIFPPNPANPVVLADARGMLDAGTREFSGRLPGEIAAIPGEVGLTTAKAYPRLPLLIEWLLIEAAAFALAGLLWLPRVTANLAMLVFIVLSSALQLCAFTLEGVWLPGAAVLIPLAMVLPSVQWLTLKLASPGNRRKHPVRGSD